MSNSRSVFLDKVRFEFGGIREITRKQADEVATKYNIPRAHWLFNDPNYRAGRGLYKLPESAKLVKSTKPFPDLAPKVSKQMVAMAPKAVATNPTVVAMVAPSVVSTNAEVSLVPEKASGYVPFGHFADVRSIIKSRKFYPTYITGLSGNGKTMMIEQICAAERAVGRRGFDVQLTAPQLPKIQITVKPSALLDEKLIFQRSHRIDPNGGLRRFDKSLVRL
jgi:hypothetical protein